MFKLTLFPVEKSKFVGINRNIPVEVYASK